MSIPKLINMSEVTQIIGASRATIYRWMDAGTFPMSIELSANRVAWFEDEVTEWINSRPRTVGINRKWDKELNEVFR